MNRKRQKEARERANELLGQLATRSFSNKDIGMESNDNDNDDEADDSETGTLF